jgi:hypothetical protein
LFDPAAYELPAEALRNFMDTAPSDMSAPLLNALAVVLALNKLTFGNKD